MTDPGGAQYAEPLFWIDRGMTVSGGYSEDWVHSASGSRTTLRAFDVGLIVTGLCAHLAEPTRLPELRRSAPARIALGHVLARLAEVDDSPWAMALVETLQRAGITPVRPQ